VIPEIQIEVAPRNGKPARLVIARFGEDGEHRSNLNTDSAISRERYFRQLAKKTKTDADELLSQWDNKLTQLADAADAAVDADSIPSDEEGGGETEQERKSQSTMLVEMVLAVGTNLFHDPDGTAYARFAVDDHLEVARLNSGAFKRWMARLYFEKTGKTPNSQAKADATGVLEGKALFDGKECAVFVRIAEHGGRIYLDLCNEKWQVVEVDAHGWRLVDESPVTFRRAKAMLPLPAPVAGGTLELLQRFLGTTGDGLVLMVAWLMAALRPRGPYPILELDGEAGSGKSTRAKMLRSLVDPNTADLRSEPREPRDLMIAASNGHVIALDNLSFLPPWLSDCLCRLATGGGFSTRTLYENDEETIFNAQRPIILNGIEQVASRGDLIDRVLLVSLLSIPEEERMPEATIWREFEAARPAMLGFLLTAVSAAIKNLPNTQVSSLPRMADFALWMIAAEPAMGWPPGTFLAAYTGNREEADHLAIESSHIGKPLLEILESAGVWEGTASELLRDLEQRAGLLEKGQKPKGWPGNARALSGSVKRVAPHLRKIGWECSFNRDDSASRHRKIAFRRMPGFCVQSVPSVQDTANSREINGSVRTQMDTSTDDWTQTAPEKPNDRTQTDGSDANSPSLSAWGQGDMSCAPQNGCGALHSQPDRWVHRDGKAYCLQCDQFMGYVRSGE
jgi:hypothetical protein